MVSSKFCTCGSTTLSRSKALIVLPGEALQQVQRSRLQVQSRLRIYLRISGVEAVQQQVSAIYSSRNRYLMHGRRVSNRIYFKSLR